jgi:hypothetical protein
MRNPRQSLRTAAISTGHAENTPKRLPGGRNPQQRFSAASLLHQGRRHRDVFDGTGFKQTLPEA